MADITPDQLENRLPGVLREAYATTGPPALLGRAWQLCRRYPKQSVLAILPSLCLMAVQSVLIVVINLMAASSHSNMGSLTGILGMLVLGLASLVMSCLSILSWLVCFVALSRFYFSAMVFDTPLSLKECFRYVLKSWPSLLLYMISWVCLSSVFLVVDLVVLGMAVFTSVFLVSLTKMAWSLPWVALIIFAALFLIGTAFLILLWSLLSAQMLALHIPLVVLANADICSGKSSVTQAELSWLDAYGLPGDRLKESRPAVFGIRPAWMGFGKLWEQTFAHIAADFPKMMAYGGMWLFFLCVWFAVWNFPLYVWAFVESFVGYLQHAPNRPGALLLIQNVIQVWNTIISGLSIPIYVSGATVFWYDSSVTRDGLDLRLWLARLRQRWLARHKT